VKAAELLGQLLLQDGERKDDGAAIKEGVSRDRIISVHDPEMRHEHKSSSTRFDGHKAATAVDTKSPDCFFCYFSYGTSLPMGTLQ